MSIIQSLTENEPSNTRELNLSSTLPSKIYKIESLQRFHSLKKLNLSNNCINKIQNLSHLTELKVLNLEFNQLTVLENLSTLTNLEELLLSYNSIDTISPQIQQNKKLKVLNLSFNQIKSLDVLTPAFSLQKLVVLSLHGNPFINTVYYMVFIKLLMPDLLILDDKDLNNTNLEGELHPQEEVAILRDTLNKLLEERNYLAEELQNLTSISSPTKITLKDYLKNHLPNSQKHQEHSLGNSNIKIATFSPIKDSNSISYLISNKNNKKEKIKSRLNRSIENQEDQQLMNFQSIESKNQINPGFNEKQKMIEILDYWKGKLEDKIFNKKQQLAELHEYYTNKLQQRQENTHSFLAQKEKRPRIKSHSYQRQHSSIQDSFKEEQMTPFNPKITTKEILSEIKQKEAELNSYKINVKSLKNLIHEINSLQPNQEMYKTIMMKVLFGSRQKQNIKSKEKPSSVKKQLNYRQLKHFLLSQYGLLNALNQLNQLVFGIGQFSIQKVNELSQWTGDKCLLQIVNEAKQQLKNLKKEQKSFEKQKQSYLKKLETETQQLYAQWSQFNENKKQFEFQKGKQFRYEQKLLQQRENEIEAKFEDFKITEAKKVEQLQQEKRQVQNKIVEMEENLTQLEEKYERRYLELEEFEKQFNSFKEEKQNMVRMQEQLKVLKKQLFQKQNLMAETTEKLKQLSLNEEINSERVKFLQRKCFQKSEEIKTLDEEEKKLKEKIRKLTEEEKVKSLQLSSLKDRVNQLTEEEKSILKNIQRHKNNLTLYEQKLKNLSELQSHKKKSIQDIELRIQEEKAEFMELNQKSLQLEEILAKKEEHIHSYQLKIAQQKKSLQSYTDISKNIQDLMDRQSELKKSILELEIQNGNLMDLKNQLIRELRQNQLSAFKSRNQWVS